MNVGIKSISFDAHKYFNLNYLKKRPLGLLSIPIILATSFIAFSNEDSIIDPSLQLVKQWRWHKIKINIEKCPNSKQFYTIKTDQSVFEIYKVNNLLIYSSLKISTDFPYTEFSCTSITIPTNIKEIL